MTRHCWKCGWDWTLTGQPGRSESCPQCRSDLRVCLNCVSYDVRAAQQCRDRRAVTVGLLENHFYQLEAEALLAASHAIEELALEEADGTLLATMQEFRHFEPHRERYWQLAATLTDVRVVAHGRQPPRHGHLKFIATTHKALGPFWTVLYQGRRGQAMLVCR